MILTDCFLQVPDDISTEDKYSFDIELVLPASSDASKLYGLSTYLPSFNQSFENLETYTNLSQVYIQGSLGNINFEVLLFSESFKGVMADVIASDYSMFKQPQFSSRLLLRKSLVPLMFLIISD